MDCPICKNAYEPDGIHQPKILKCGHTICIDCIVKLSMSSPMGLKCPYCFGVTPVGSMGVHALPNNAALITVVNNMKIHDVAETEDRAIVEDLCCACKTEKAVKICFSCDPLGCKLCEACCTLEHGRDFAPIRMHKPILIEDVDPKKHRNQCHNHHGQSVTHFSEKTRTFACQKCLDSFSDDIRSFYNPIEAATHSCKAKLEPIMCDIEKYLERVQDAHHKVSTIQNQLRWVGPKTIQDIQTQFAEFQRIFTERQKTLVNDTETFVS